MTQIYSLHSTPRPAYIVERREILYCGLNKEKLTYAHSAFRQMIEQDCMTEMVISNDPAAGQTTGADAVMLRTVIVDRNSRQIYGYRQLMACRGTAQGLRLYKRHASPDMRRQLMQNTPRAILFNILWQVDALDLGTCLEGFVCIGDGNAESLEKSEDGVLKADMIAIFRAGGNGDVPRYLNLPDRTLTR